MSDAAAAPRTRVLYLLTDEISSVLVRGQLGHLVGEGFDVTVAARRAVPDEQPEPGRWDDGVAVEHLPFVREPSPLADLRALRATVRLIRRLRPTIVNASTPKAGLLGMLAARMCRVPVRVYVVRGFRFETATGWRRRVFRGSERVAIRCANHVVFNSRSLMAVGEREGLIAPGRGEVIGGGSGNGIDVSRFACDALPTRAEARERFGLPEEATVVGFVGRLTRDKGIEDLVEVFETALTDDADTWLLLVGQFEEGDPVAHHVRRTIEVHDRIVVVPWLDHPGIAYRAMDVLAFPSYREGLPNVPLEAQLCGVPVVGYAATGTVDAVTPDELDALVEVGDTGALRRALWSARDRALDGSDQHVAANRRALWVRVSFDRQVVHRLLERQLRVALAEDSNWPDRRNDRSPVAARTIKSDGAGAGTTTATSLRRMDRRTAMRKIAAGGVATLGASAIISSPAFADGGSTSARVTVPKPVPGTPTNVTVDGFDLDVTFPTAICPVGGGDAKMEVQANLRNSGTDPSTDGAGVSGPGVGGRTTTLGVESYSFTWGTDATPRVTVEFLVRYTCPDFQAGEVAWACGRLVLRAERGQSPEYDPSLTEGPFGDAGDTWCNNSPTLP